MKKMSEGVMSTEARPRLGEEIANAITHGIGALLALAGLVFLAIYAEAGSTVSFAIYGSTLVVLSISC